MTYTETLVCGSQTVSDTLDDTLRFGISDRFLHFNDTSRLDQSHCFGNLERGTQSRAVRQFRISSQSDDFVFSVIDEQAAIEPFSLTFSNALTHMYRFGKSDTKSLTDTFQFRKWTLTP